MKSRLLLLPLLLLLAGQCAAQLPPSARMGRLFFWPGERAVLDSKRGAAPAVPGNPNAPGGVAPPPGGPPPDASGALPPGGPGSPGAASAPSGPVPVELSGVLSSSSGRTTTWLNAEPSAAGTPAAGGKVALRLSSGRKLVLKPGQTYDAASGAVRDSTPASADPAAPQAAPLPPLPPPDFRQ